MTMLKRYFQVTVCHYLKKNISREITNGSSSEQNAIRTRKTWRELYCSDRLLAFVLMYSILICYAANYNMALLYQSYYKDIFSDLPYNVNKFFAVAYFVPNTFICFIVGLIVDRLLGIKIVSYVLAGMNVVGQIILSIGTLIEYGQLILFGRVVNGIGNESLVLLINCYVVLWSDEDICFWFSLNQLFSIIGNSVTVTLSAYLNAYLHDCFYKEHIIIALLLCTYVGLMIIQLICVVALYRISVKNDKPVKMQSEKSDNQTVTFRNLNTFSPIFFIILVELCFCNSVIFVFLSNIQDLLNAADGIATLNAGDIHAFFNLASVLMGPLTGLIVGWTGNLHMFNILGMFSGFSSILMMLFTLDNIAVPLTLLAFCLAVLNTCAFSLITRAAKHYQMATAFGIAQSGMIIFSTMLHYIINRILSEYGVRESLTVFFAFIIVALISSGIAFYIDKQGIGFLLISDSKKKKYEES